MSQNQHEDDSKSESVDVEPDRHDLRLTTSNAEKSATIVPAPTEDDAQLSRQDTEAIYAKFSPNRKRLVTAVVACGGISSTVSTLLLLAAIPEIAGEFNTSGSIINVSNAIYTVFMGISTLFWGPVSQVYGRKWELEGLDFKTKTGKVWDWTNPFRVLALFRIPKLLVAGIAASSLVWNMQSLLTPIRYVINPRFHLTTPLQSGLFFLAPGIGFFTGTYFGGRYADHTVKLWIKRRGHRLPEDRLRSSFVAMGIVIPCAILIYGWAIEKEKGGIPLPVICMFVQGFAQTICFPSINTYCLDVFKGRSAEVIAGNYFFRYAIAAVGTAVCLPAINSIGVGWFNTITALFVFGSTAAVFCVVMIESRKDEKNSGEGV
ncbi:hypothetical protein K4K58_013013 [Colletotrichum sp. SAR11_239]|nr:hypothetical protein K4K58_013013 [Colletotrichum sp. SAR11_239]